MSWIKCSEQLPEFHLPVLIFSRCPNGFKDDGTYEPYHQHKMSRTDACVHGIFKARLVQYDKEPYWAIDTNRFDNLNNMYNHRCEPLYWMNLPQEP